MCAMEQVKAAGSGALVAIWALILASIVDKSAS